MSDLKSRVGKWDFKWKEIPRGKEGKLQVSIPSGELIELHWKRDAEGVWIVLPHGIFGFDLHQTTDENGQQAYTASRRSSPQEWKDVIPSFGSTINQGGVKSQARSSMRVRAQMPGKIIKVLIEPGQIVQKDQPLMVMEAMKMENEIRSLHLGKISQVKVVEGQAVETGADLVLLEPTLA